MKYCFDGVIVVEGNNDVSFLSSFIDSVFVITNGYEISSDELDFLKNINNKVIILTDSDEAGRKIREKLNNELINTINVEVDATKCNKNNKHGVAECEKEEVVRCLKPHFCGNSYTINYSLADLNRLGIDNKEKRNYLAEQFHLGKCNNKTLLKRLSFKQINIDDIEKVMEGYNGN